MGDCSSKMMNFNVFFEQKFYFLDTTASVAVFGFMDMVIRVGDGIDNGPDAVAVVVDHDFLSTERVWRNG